MADRPAGPPLYEEEFGYKVDLEVFSGPLDLLLYLIRQEEVEITDIPIARITDAYLQHLELMQQVNVNVAGEFLVMAATLMEIKSRSLLPRPEREGEEEEDPRADLIRQLIEYKKFKDAARSLAARAGEQALKFARGAAAVLGLPERQPEEDLRILLDEVGVWQLMDAFRTILSQTTLDTTRHIVLDERPAYAYCNDLLDELRARGAAAFRELFDVAEGRLALIHAFMALLELIRRRRVRAEQAGPHGEIRIVLLDDTPVSESELVETRPPEPPARADEAAPGAPAPEPEPAAAGADADADAGAEEALPDAELDAISLPWVEPAEESAEEDLGGAAPPEAAPAPAEPGEAPAPPAPAPAEARPPRRAARARAKAKRKQAARDALRLRLRRRAPKSLLARLPRCRPAGRPHRPVAVILATRARRGP